MSISPKNRKNIMIVVGVLIFIGCAIMNSTIGNPLSAAMSEKAIRVYVEQTYPELELTVGKANYNFKFNEYMATATSNDSKDTHFPIYCSGWKVTRDDYDSCVTNKFNTLQRFESEYSKLAISILTQEAMLKNNTSMVVLENWEDEKSKIPLDTPFDKTLPTAAKLIIRFDMTDPSIKDVANIVEKSYELMKENGCHFKKYDLFSEYNGQLVMVNDVKPEDIESGKLESILEESKTQGDNAEIYVDIHKVSN